MFPLNLFKLINTNLNVYKSINLWFMKISSIKSYFSNENFDDIEHQGQHTNIENIITVVKPSCHRNDLPENLKFNIISSKQEFQKLFYQNIVDIDIDDNDFDDCNNYDFSYKCCDEKNKSVNKLIYTATGIKMFLPSSLMNVTFVKY